MNFKKGPIFALLLLIAFVVCYFYFAIQPLPSYPLTIIDPTRTTPIFIFPGRKPDTTIPEDERNDIITTTTAKYQQIADHDDTIKKSDPSIQDKAGFNANLDSEKQFVSHTTPEKIEGDDVPRSPENLYKIERDDVPATPDEEYYIATTTTAISFKETANITESRAVQIIQNSSSPITEVDNSRNTSLDYPTRSVRKPDMRIPFKSSIERFKNIIENSTDFNKTTRSDVTMLRNITRESPEQQPKKNTTHDQVSDVSTLFFTR